MRHPIPPQFKGLRPSRDKSKITGISYAEIINTSTVDAGVGERPPDDFGTQNDIQAASDDMNLELSQWFIDNDIQEQNMRLTNRILEQGFYEKSDQVI